MSYQDLLRDPRWQRKRLEIMNRDHWRCTFCGDANSTLHIHHLFYVSGRAPWQYLNSALTTLCEECHSHHEDLDAPAEEMAEEWEHLIDVSGKILPIEVMASALESLIGHKFGVMELFENLIRLFNRLNKRKAAKCQPGI